MSTIVKNPKDKCRRAHTLHLHGAYSSKKNPIHCVYCGYIPERIVFKGGSI